MGGCFSEGQDKYHAPINYNRINIDELVDSWSSGEVLMMKDRVEEFCQLYGKKRMSKDMLLEFFPAIRRNYPDAFRQRLFSFFDWNHTKEISTRQIINGLSVLLKIPDDKFHEILYALYRKPNEPGRRSIRGQDFLLFFNENRSMLKKQAQDPGFTLALQPNVQLKDFKSFMRAYYDIQKFKGMFDVDKSEEEYELIKELNKSDYKIGLVEGEIVYAVEIKWFESWKHYVEHKYRLTSEIRFAEARNSKYIRNSVPVSAESILFKVENKELYMKPRMIDNNYLEGEFEDGIKEGLQLFHDFVVVTEPIWNCLKKVYGGGPEFKRRYPEIFPVVINKVYLNSHGEFAPDQIKKYLISFRNHLTDSVIKEDQIRRNCIIYKKNIGDNVWIKLDMTKTVGDNDITSQGFVCAVKRQVEQQFLTNYSSMYPDKQNKRMYGYGDLVNVRVDKEILTGYIMEMGKDNATVFFKNKPIEAKQVISFSDLSNFGASVSTKTVTLVSGLKNLGNSCYMNAVIQSIIATPVLSDFLLNERYKYYISEVNKPKQDKLIVCQLSQLVKKTSSNLAPVRPTDLRKAIVGKMPQFDNYDQQDAEEFLCSFLNTLSEQTLTKKVSLVNTVEFEALEQNQENYSVFDKFYLGQIVQKLKCLNCQKETVKKENTYSLSVPVPEIQYAFYFAKFYPAKHDKKDTNFAPITRFGVKVKKAVLLQELVQRFAHHIGKPVAKLSFAVVQGGSIRVLFLEHHYKRKLTDLHLRQSDDIYIYQQKLAIPNFQQYPQQPKPKKLAPIQPFPEGLQSGSLADIYYFYEWQICLFLSFNKQKKQVKVETLQGENEFSVKCLAPYLSNTITKRVVVYVVHRKYSAAKKRLVTFSTPFLVSVGEWMQWNEIVDIVNAEAERFVDREYYLMKSQETPNPDDPNFAPPLKRGYSSSHIHEEMDKKESKSRIYEDSKYQRREINVGSTFEKERQHTHTVWATKVPYVIKILNKIDDTCGVCGGFTKIDNEAYQKRVDYYQRTFLEKECPGCAVKQNMPISLIVNLHNIYLSLDWSQTLAFRSDLTRIVNHPSSIAIQDQEKQLKNPLSECLTLFGKQEDGIERKCQNPKCRFQWSTMQSFISKSPNILVIHLKRFKINGGYLQKMQNRIEIPHNVSLNSLAYEKMPDNKYQLFAIVCHKGGGFGGHYISYVFKNKKTWVKCDDDVTTIVDFNSINLTEVYLIFYRKLNMPSSLLAL